MYRNYIGIGMALHMNLSRHIGIQQVGIRDYIYIYRWTYLCSYVVKH